MRSKYTLRIVARNIMPHDAVGNFNIHLISFLKQRDENVQAYAQGIAEKYTKFIRPVAILQDDMRPDDILLCHYSILDEYFENYIHLPCARKILYYHNVTPGKFFRQYTPALADLLDAAPRQYQLFSVFDAAIANSYYSLDQIRPFLRAGIPELVFPPHLGLDWLRPVADPTRIPLPAAQYTLLWIGRIVPHKRPDLALRVFDELVRSGENASLTFVGGGRYDFPAFSEHIDACLAALNPTARTQVQFLQYISSEQLAYLYHKASLLLCTSAHEGYCMPLVEAAACNLPVAAMPQPAVLETLGGRGLILDEDPQKAARQIRDFLVNNDEEERRRATPVVPDLPTDALLRLILGEE